MALSPLPTEGNTMIVKVVCTCGHFGVVNAESLPRDLVCSRCGEARQVQAADGRPVRSRDAVMEWLLGSKAAS
jgi:hypothetical protein